MSEGNGRWQLGFWIMSVVFMGALVFLGTNVIANDRKNTEEFTIVRKENDIKVNALRLEIKDDLKEIQLAQSEQIIKLERILTKLETIDRKVK